MIGRRLAELRASKIFKRETEEVNENEIRAPSNRQIREPQVKQNLDPIREQFLNKTVSVQNVVDNLQGSVDVNNIKHENVQVEGIFNRAQGINAKIRGDIEEQTFYARIPQNIEDSAKATFSHNDSPLVQNYGNAIFSFQATSDNVKEVMINSNPYRDVPYQVQNFGKTIGANLELIKKRTEEESKKRKPPPVPSISQASKSAKIDSQPSTSGANGGSRYEAVPKETCNRTTQTTVDTGDLRFEITSTELENLCEMKKVILLEFMKAFNIRDNKNVSSIRERLEHRLKNQARKRGTTYGSVSSAPTFGPPI